MPKLPRLNTKYYLGMDPGEKGGLAVLCADGLLCSYHKMPETALELWQLVDKLSNSFAVDKAVIERIDPRPTVWFDKTTQQRKSSILRSTCIIYGDYLQLHMVAIAADLDVEVVGPYDWQKFLGIEKRAKGETKVQFKRRLKMVAQDLFPDTKVTLAIADAILIAEYARRKYSA